MTKFPETVSESVTLVLEITAPFRTTSRHIVRMCCPASANDNFVENAMKELVRRGYFIHYWPPWSYHSIAAHEGRARPLEQAEAMLKDMFPETIFKRPPKSAYLKEPLPVNPAGLRAGEITHASQRSFSDSVTARELMKAIRPRSRAVFKTAAHILEDRPEGVVKLAPIIWERMNERKDPHCPRFSTSVGPYLFLLRQHGFISNEGRVYRLTERGRQAFRIMENADTEQELEEDWEPREFLKEIPRTSRRIFREIVEVDKKWGRLPKGLNRVLASRFQVNGTEEVPKTGPGVNYHIRFFVRHGILIQVSKGRYVFSDRGVRLAKLFS